MGKKIRLKDANAGPMDFGSYIHRINSILNQNDSAYKDDPPVEEIHYKKISLGIVAQILIARLLQINHHPGINNLYTKPDHSLSRANQVERQTFISIADYFFKIFQGTILAEDPWFLKINQFLSKESFSPENFQKLYSIFMDLIKLEKSSLPEKLPDDYFNDYYEEFILGAEHRKKHGSYFTSDSLVKFILHDVNFINPSTGAPQNGTGYSVLDPCCGSGNFIRGALKKILEPGSYSDRSIGEYGLSNPNIKFYGLDIDSFHIYFAKINLLMAIIPIFPKQKDANSIFKKITLEQVSDSLVEFSSAKNLPQFDLIMGNPPYVGYNHGSKLGLPIFKNIKDRKILLNNIFGVNLHSTPFKKKKYGPKPNLFAFFIAMGYGLLRDGGLLAYIVPQTFLTAMDLDVVRYHLANFMTIDKLIFFHDDMFSKNESGGIRQVSTSSVILLARKRKPPEDHRVKILFIAREGLNKESEGPKKGVYLESSNNKKILQSSLRETISNWNFIRFEEKFRKGFEVYKRASQDINIYYDHMKSKNFFGSIFYFDKGAAFHREDLVTEDLLPKSRSPLEYFPVLKSSSRNLQKSSLLKTSGLYIARDKVVFPQGSQGWPVFEKKYRIIWRYMNPVSFYLSRREFLINYNYVIISSSSGDEIYYLFALLNSTFIRKILQNLFMIPGEKDILMGITSIKEQFRVPVLDLGKQDLKKQIIHLVSQVTQEPQAGKEIKSSESIWAEINEIVLELYSLPSQLKAEFR